MGFVKYLFDIALKLPDHTLLKTFEGSQKRVLKGPDSIEGVRTGQYQGNGATPGGTEGAGVENGGANEQQETQKDRAGSAQSAEVLK